MNIPRIIRKLKTKLFNKEYQHAMDRQRFMTDIMTTNAYAKMTMQDKITSLAKLILIFRCDYGFVPKKLERTLVDLNENLNGQVKQEWFELYKK